MQIKKRLYSSFVVILLTTSSLLIFICLNLFTTNANNPSLPIPKDADWVIQVDLEMLLKQEAYNTLFSQKDELLLAEIRNIIENRESKNTNSGNLKINLKEDCVLYGLTINHKKYVAAVLKTTDTESFNKHVGQLLSYVRLARAQNGNAVFLLQSEQGNTTQKELESVIDYIFDSPINVLKKAPAEKNEFVSVRVNQLATSSSFSKLNTSFQFQDKRLLVVGDVKFSEELSKPLNFGLKSEGLYIYSRLIPGSLPDTLLALLPKNIPHFTEIESFAIDFQGTALEEPIDSFPNFVGFLPVPIMNLIVRTQEPCDVKKLWSAFPQSMRKENMELDFGNTTYRLKQLDSVTYFMGVDDRAIVPFSRGDAFFIKGTLIKTTKIYGSTFVTAFIDNTGPMKAMNDFLKSSDFIDVKLIPAKNNTYQIKGEIRFNEGKHPIHQLTKLILELGKIVL